MRLLKRQISFDLDTKELREHYTNKSFNNAYGNIKRYMLKNGFEWVQGSVYVSEKAIPLSMVTYHLIMLRNKYDWLKYAMRDCNITNIGKTHNVNNIFGKK